LLGQVKASQRLFPSVENYKSDGDANARSRILIVDDNEDAAIVLSSLLRKNRHEVQAARSRRQPW
jgi:PleD family two-component response regulator